jgi:3-hydroxyacyl-[acyl-carrier-protein] dehydratase
MNELYEISRGREEGLFEVRLNPDHAIFDGHFPSNPVLPGICTLAIVRECARQMTGQPLSYTSIKESKFLAAITPQTPLSVRLKLSEEGNSDSLTATVCHGDIIMLKLKASLQSDE